jgi:hypothetical protein
LIRFVWNRLIHAPCPDALVFIVSYNSKYLLSPEIAKPYDSGRNSVQMLIGTSFDVSSLSRHFSYKGRDIATPYLSCLNLEDPINNRALLGNAVYSPGVNRYDPWSFRDFFTGSNDLGFYILDDSQFGINHRNFWEEHYLSRYVDFGYYVVDLLSRKRISEFFDKYEEAERFAESLFYGEQARVKGIRFVPYAYFLKLDVVLSGVRNIRHPLGFFSCVKTQTGTIFVSELFLFFRNILVRGGGDID